jgi:cytochrome c oxidase cbb3-type subunit 3
MISWEPLLSPEQMQNVASYVMSMGGTTPANPKDPQGELYVPEPAGEEVASDSVETMAMQ